MSAILVLAGFLRFAALERYPTPVNPDELSNMYDGWSIAETGAERAGRKWPIICYAGGLSDNRPALMAWLCAVPSWFVGFTVVGCRGVSAVFGLISVLLVGVWGWRVLGFRGALLTMLLLALSPWHLLFSRWAIEGAALPGFFCVLTILLVREAGERLREGKAAYWLWAGAGLVTGFSTNSYAGMRLTALIFALLGAGLALGMGHRSALRWPARAKVLTLFILAVGIGAAPQIYVFLTDREMFFARAERVRFHPFDWLDAVETFVENVAAHLDPVYLFLSFGEQRQLMGCLSAAAMPFLYVGLLSLMWPRTGWSVVDRALLLVGVLACIAPAALTRTNPHAFRASGCSVLLPMISGLGMVQTGRWAMALWSRLWGERAPSQRGRIWSNGAAILMAGVILVFGGSYVVRYLSRPDLQNALSQPDWVAMGKWLIGRTQRYDRVYITPVGNESKYGIGWDLYVAAFSGMHPSEWQRAERDVWGRYSDACVRLNQFYARKRWEALEAWEESGQDECWLVTDYLRSDVLELGCGHE